jgi:hypothetical protein
MIVRVYKDKLFVDDRAAEAIKVMERESIARWIEADHKGNPLSSKRGLELVFAILDGEHHNHPKKTP